MNPDDTTSRKPRRLALILLAGLLALGAVLGAGVAAASGNSDQSDGVESEPKHPGDELQHPGDWYEGPPADAVDIPLDELPAGAVVDPPH